MQRFHVKGKKFSRFRIVLCIGILPIFLISLIELYRGIMPFNTTDPLWKDVTVGEPVINGWVYGGYDEEGFLKFYKNGMLHTLSPSSHLLALDGKFVVIEESSENSLTFAPRLYEAVPLKWDFIIFGVSSAISIGGSYFVLRRYTKVIRRNFNSKTFKPHR